jgi:hypothetical protein
MDRFLSLLPYIIGVPLCILAPTGFIMMFVFDKPTLVIITIAYCLFLLGVGLTHTIKQVLD